MTTFNIPFGDTIMTKLYKTRIRSLLAIGMLASVVFVQQTATAQTVNSPGSVLHGRTKQVDYSILDALGIDIPFSVLLYDEVTDANQLSDITRLSITSFTEVPFSLRAGDFDGLTNLQDLDFSSISSRILTLLAGIFDKLTSLQSLDLSGRLPVLLPDGVFDKSPSEGYLRE